LGRNGGRRKREKYEYLIKRSEMELNLYEIKGKNRSLEKGIEIVEGK
jgi:hypothetical protein